MIAVRVGKQIRGYCDWCAQPQSKPLVPVTISTPRGVFREELCAACAQTISGPEDESA